MQTALLRESGLFCNRGETKGPAPQWRSEHTHAQAGTQAEYINEQALSDMTILAHIVTQ